MDPNHQEKMPHPHSTQSQSVGAPPPYTPVDSHSPAGVAMHAPPAPQHSYPQQQVPLMAPPPTSPNMVKPQPYPYPQQQIPMATGPTSPPVMVTSAPPVVMAQPHTVTNVVVSTQSAALGNGPTCLICPTCHQNVCTKTRKTLKADAWICCILLCLFGCELCFWIPFVMDSNYRVEHTCPNCHSYVGAAI